MLVIGAICDKCGRSELFQNHDTKKELIRMLRNKGWSIGKGRTFGAKDYTLCPYCRRGGIGEDE